jgi:hypothetical protein
MNNIFIDTIKPIKGLFVNIAKKLYVKSNEDNLGTSGEGALLVEGGANIKKNVLIEGATTVKKSMRIEGDLMVLGTSTTQSAIALSIPEWIGNNYYTAGFILRKRNTIYYCITAHTSTYDFYNDWYISGLWMPLSEPPGMIKTWPKATIPKGYLLCNGASFLTDYLELYGILGKWTVPDLRGKFIRGQGQAYNDLGNILTNRLSGALGVTVEDSFENHIHSFSDYYQNTSLMEAWHDAGSGVYDAYAQAGATTPNNTAGSTGSYRYGLETKPINIAYNYIIKY